MLDRGDDKGQQAWARINGDRGATGSALRAGYTTAATAYGAIRKTPFCWKIGITGSNVIGFVAEVFGAAHR